MRGTRMPAVAVLFPMLLLAGGCRRAEVKPAAVAGVSTTVEAALISGPYLHKNLAVFFIRSDTQDPRDFLTLDEGLASGKVQVTEQAREQVGQLTIDNQADQPLYLQEGERLQGGKQDRTIIASLVVPPHSGPTPLPAACIEQGRWTTGANGTSFGFATNSALAPKGVRGAAKIDGSQQAVWANVAAQKMTLANAVNAANNSTSLNEAYDSPQVQEVSDDYAAGLRDALDKHPDAVGVVVVVNGRFEEANVYPNHKVLARLYPRLIQSYAVQAVLLKDQDKGTLPTVDEIARVMQEQAEKPADAKESDARRSATALRRSLVSAEREAAANATTSGTANEVRQLAPDVFRCATRYEGKVVHWQVLKKNGTGETNKARAAALGSDW
jgi:hypothetical protein